LFIAEQAGRVRVWQPGSSTTSQFLDVRSRVSSGGERGLLGLAFHPLYSANGRFFLYYTRPIDGAIVVAEYGVSADPNVANPTERVLLTIPHPTFSNHNGGMLAFGPGGYLHIGVGDGGSGNDPPNNAQNVETLLGKILRINVDQDDAAAGTPYSSPPSNPFVGKPGRDEILAFGLRNPWRFSFDRASGRAWVGDVGQGAREEINTPLVEGGNYGWRVFEGSECTGNDPALCRTGNYVAPTFEYSHGNGRCSVTGGYAYRGIRFTFIWATYVYGDFCSGEVFSWDGIQQRVVVDTNLNISSFGEDEDGEIYVVDLRGTIGRLARR
jgi:glucose/arabinose dehydrogenase